MTAHKPAVRYPGYGREVNALLDLARAANQVEKMFPTAVVLIQINESQPDPWWHDLVDIILDHEEAHDRP